MPFASLFCSVQGLVYGLPAEQLLSQERETIQYSLVTLRGRTLFCRSTVEVVCLGREWEMADRILDGDHPRRSCGLTAHLLAGDSSRRSVTSSRQNLPIVPDCALTRRRLRRLHANHAPGLRSCDRAHSREVAQRGRSLTEEKTRDPWLT